MWRLSKKKTDTTFEFAIVIARCKRFLRKFTSKSRNNRSEKKITKDETNGRSRELCTVTWKHPLRKIEQRSRYFGRIISCQKQTSPDFINYATFVTKEISKWRQQEIEIAGNRMTGNLMPISYDISTFHFLEVSLLMCVQKGLKYIRLKCVSNNDISTFHFSFSGSYVYLFICSKVSNILYLNTCQTRNKVPNYS